jgi:murein DD-endopeptidase MepM/ murein hydrolase activator NlpD
MDRKVRSVPRVQPGLGAGIVAGSFAVALAISGAFVPPTARSAPGAARQFAPQVFLVPDIVSVLPVRRDGYTVTLRQPLVRWPVSALTPVRDGFGPRVAPCAGCSSMHAGVDFDAGDGAQVQAIADGIVLANHPNQSALGTYVAIRHLIEGRMFVSVYAHLRVGSTRFRPGDSVAGGDPIGLVGNTGRSTGPHLHFEIRLDGVTAIDPLLWLRAEAH